MESADNLPEPTVRDEARERILAMLDEFRKQAESGTLQGIAVAYLRKDGVADVLSTPMGIVSLNHLGRLFDLRVVAGYRNAMTKESVNRSPTGAMRATSPKPIPDVDPKLPRNTRRLLKRAQQKVLDKSKRRAPPLPIPKAVTRKPV